MAAEVNVPAGDEVPAGHDGAKSSLDAALAPDDPGSRPDAVPAPGDAASSSDDGQSPRFRPGRALLAAGVAAAAACCLVVSVLAGLHARAELSRRPTAADRSAAAVIAVAQRWRRWPAGQIFPARLGYTTALHTRETARRAGIAAGSACAAALDTAAGRQALRDGCRAALRATYADELQGIIYTVGVVAFAGPSGAAAFLRAFASYWHGGQVGARALGGGPSASRRIHDPGDFSVVLTEKSPRYGLRAHPVAGTAAARFSSAARQVMTGRQQGPYVVLTVAGYADGRPAVATGHRRRPIFWPAAQLAAEILAQLTMPPDVTCSLPEWRC